MNTSFLVLCDCYSGIVIGNQYCLSCTQSTSITCASDFMNSSVACCNNTSCPWCYNASTKQSSCLIDSHWCQHIFGMSWFPSFQFSFYMYASTFLTFSSREAWVAGSHEHSFVCHNDFLVQKCFFQCWLMWSKYEKKSTVLKCCWLTPVDCHRCLHECCLLLECCHQACISLLSFLSYCNLIQDTSEIMVRNHSVA